MIGLYFTLIARDCSNDIRTGSFFIYLPIYQAMPVYIQQPFIKKNGGKKHGKNNNQRGKKQTGKVQKL